MTSAKTTVRPATLDDVEFLVRVIDLTSRPPSTEGTEAAKTSWIEGLTQDATEQVLGTVANSATYVIHSGAERVGRLRVVRTEEHLHIAGIQIMPDHQRRGIGTDVITVLLREAAERSAPVVLQVNMNNPGAERLYTRLGFRRSGEEGNDYWMTARSPRGSLIR